MQRHSATRVRNWLRDLVVVDCVASEHRQIANISSHHRQLCQMYYRHIAGE